MGKKKIAGNQQIKIIITTINANNAVEKSEANEFFFLFLCKVVECTISKSRNRMKDEKLYRNWVS
jgi:hypothetical protein